MSLLEELQGERGTAHLAHRQKDKSRRRGQFNNLLGDILISSFSLLPFSLSLFYLSSTSSSLECGLNSHQALESTHLQD